MDSIKSLTIRILKKLNQFRVYQAFTDELMHRRIFFEQSRDGIVILDANGKVYEANQHYADMLGYSVEEVCQRHLWDWDAQWTREELLDKIKQVDLVGEQFETRHRRKDGAMIDVEVVSSVAEWDGRKLILCICRDITERKRTDKQLTSLSERLTLATQYAGVGIWDYDVSTDHFISDETLLKLYGAPPEQPNHNLQAWLRYIHPDDLSRVKAEIRTAIAGSTYNTCFRVIRPNGEIRFIQSIAKVQHDGSGQPLRFVGANWDITDFKTTEQALRDNEERLQRVLDGVNEGFWDWNIATGEVLFSHRWVEMLDYDPVDIAPHVSSWKNLMHPEDLPHCQAALERHFHGEASQYQCEYRMRTKYGKWRWILDRGKVTRRDANGHPLWMAGAHTDIHERCRMEETLRTTLAEIRHHNLQMAAANRMGNLLLSCETLHEAYEIIARSAEILFADHTGGLAISEENTPMLRLAAHWGNSCPLPLTLPFDQCWALRRKELYEVTDAVYGIYCPHFSKRPAYASFCLPLIVRGETLGLLHVSAGRLLSGEQLEELRNLVIKVGESAKLALSNLKLWGALREQAIRDPLTGLFNRRYLDETLPRELHRCRRNGEPLIVAMLDLDYFKSFNDHYGHEAGDTVLRAVGELLQRSLRSEDLACRYGGEELVLILPGAPLTMAQARLEDLRQAVMQLHPQYRNGDLPAITVSIGLAMAKPEETDANALLSRADAALYRAKEQGRNRIMAADGT